MPDTSYNDIAGWYDAYLREKPMYRDILLPHLLDLVGDAQGLDVCDLACGQGWIARELARRGACVTGLDFAENLLALARRYEEQEPLGIAYQQGDAQEAASVAGGSFDGCVCVMALMNIPDLKAVFATARRILKAGGWFAFAITHPCFQTPHAKWISMEDGTVVRAVNGYFVERFWESSSPGGIRSRVGEEHRMLSTYLNTLAAASFVFERMVEPQPGGEFARQAPESREAPSLLLVRARAV